MLRFKMMASASTSTSGIRSMESNHKQLVVLRCKLVIVGEAAVGKTALTQVFTSGGPTFPKNYLMVRKPLFALMFRFAANDSNVSLLLFVSRITDRGSRVLCEAGSHSGDKCDGGIVHL